MPVLKTTNAQSIYYRLIERSHQEQKHYEKQRSYLVFLHEGLGCDSLWKNFPDSLCKATGCPGIVYDRLGYGKSSPLLQDRTIHYMHEYALKELPYVLNALIPDQEFILVGHSDGGSISLIYAAEQPQLLKGLVTEAAHIYVEPETIEGIKQADEAWKKGKLKGLSKFHGEKTETTFKAWSNTWLSVWFLNWNIEYLLPSIKSPLLCIQGEDDQYASKKQLTDIAEKSGGISDSLLLRNCAHTPHLEAGSEVLKAMTDFIHAILED